MFFKIVVLKNFANFTGKHLCWSLFLIKLQAHRQVFSCEICEICKNIFFKEHLRWLPLNHESIADMIFFSQICFILGVERPSDF